MQSQNPILTTAIEQSIATITLNRPRERNSLSLGLLMSLRQTVNELGANANARVIVLKANGPVFCAGHDLKEMTTARQQEDRGRAFFTRTMKACSEVMQAIVHCPKPVIASVQGTATAAGCQLVASCDLAIAAGGVRFATPGVNIGLFCSTPMVALSRNLGRKASMEMLLIGDMIDADTAMNWGLVNKVAAPEKLHSEIQNMAQTIATKSAATLRIGKEAFYKQLEHNLSDAYAYATEVMVENMMNEDAKEGIDAFLTKREPRWPLT